MSKIINLKDKLGNILYSKDILEQGDDYIKFADGRLVCEMFWDLTINKSDWVKWGTEYVYHYYPNAVFPQRFKEKPKISITSTGDVGGLVSRVAYTNAVITYMPIMRPDISPDGSKFQFCIITFGRWK